jgi:imidazolonepropionase-like amidohydrolase
MQALNRMLVAIALCVLTAPSAWSATTEQFTVVASGEVVGSLQATRDGHTVAIDYQVSNNGRGPRLTERIVLGDDDLPTAWSVDGTTAFGGRVAERFTRKPREAVWESQADRGRTANPGDKLYVTNDGSPWRFGLYARALLQAPNRVLDALPSGKLRLDKVRDLTIGDVQITAYLLTGINLTPDIVFLDSHGGLFAQAEMPESVIVRTGFEKHAKELIGLVRDAESTQLERLQRQAAHRFDTPLRIRNVRIFYPLAKRLGEPVTVVVFRDRIASIEPLSEFDGLPGEHMIDGAGGTLLAGLHDMHSHNTAWSGVFYLAAGVTNVRDLGNANEELLQLSDKIERGVMMGPRMQRAGFLEGRSPYSARYGRIPETLPKAIEDVRWYASHGYRQIKIYNSMTPDWVASIAAEAHRLGLRVSGHVPAFMSPDRAIRDGYDEINHLNQLVLGWLLQPTDDTRTPLRLTAMGERMASLELSSAPVRATIDLMRERNTALDPTIVIIERLMMSRAGKVNEGDAPYLDHAPIGYQRYRRRSFVDFKSREHEQTYARSFDKLLETLQVLHAAGIRLLPGTDDGTGFTLHRELELYAKAGIAPADVLSLATLGCARYLGRDQELGSIEPGKLADFMLLDGDPTRDISTIRRARLVMKNDAVYFPAELYEAIGIRPFNAPPAIRTVQ